MDALRYRLDRTYDWNYDHAPGRVDHVDSPADRNHAEFIGLPIDSPLGIAAGPLLNGKWIQYYASLGFSVLTYKTVRSSHRACYEPPNLTPVATRQISGSESALPSTETLQKSWAVSFGMPSKDPSIWRADVEATRRRLSKEHVLSVSVVGTMQPEWTVEELADDYALCAKWAIESGADCVETNFSCPNVDSCDGQLYQNAVDAKVIAERVRSRIGNARFLIKIGHFANSHDGNRQASELLHAVANVAHGVVTTNSIATTVTNERGELMFDGQKRGICGDAIREESVRQTSRIRAIIDEHKLPLKIIGVGGISTAEHVRQYVAAGAESVQIATAAMLDPMVGLRIRAEL